MEKAKRLVDLHIYYNQSLLIEELINHSLIDCYTPGIDEVMEWWLVSGWLAERLTMRGEVILSEYGCQWWGRACSGQALHMDWVIEQIAEEYLI